MIRVALEPTFEGWRDAVRPLLAARVPADRLVFVRQGEAQVGLFGSQAAPTGHAPVSLPRRFVELARTAICFDAPDRFTLPYRVALRLLDDRGLLDDITDDDIHTLGLRSKRAQHEIHAMHAFVRFQPIADADGERWVAFHRPEHWVVGEAAPHFVERFGSMAFAILTPKGSALYTPERGLEHGPPVDAPPRRPEDPLQGLWGTYYASIYDRGRGVAASTQLPRKHWATMPETARIPEMIRAQPRTGSDRADVRSRLPPGDADGATFAAALRPCDACELAGRPAVPGEGPLSARIVLVGEQPGDVEDRVGRPFVGPAGQVLDGALVDAGLDRRALYLTNAVKHFRYIDTFTKRIHEKPDRYHVEVCRPWVIWELERIRPTVVVALGATAARSLLGRAVRIDALRGEVLRTALADHLLVAPHPSAVLRAGDGGPAVRAHLVETLVRARQLAD